MHGQKHCGFIDGNFVQRLSANICFSPKNNPNRPHSRTRVRNRGERFLGGGIWGDFWDPIWTQFGSDLNPYPLSWSLPLQLPLLYHCHYPYHYDYDYHYNYNNRLVARFVDQFSDRFRDRCLIDRESTGNAQRPLYINKFETPDRPGFAGPYVNI